MAVKRKKTAKNATTELTPMQDYINQKLIATNERKVNRKALAGFVDDAHGYEDEKEHRIYYNEKQRHEVAMKFKRLFCSLRAIAFIYGKYSGAMRDHSAGLVNMGVYLRRIIDAFNNINTKIIDCDMAISKMWHECLEVEGISGEDLDINNDNVLQGVIEVAMNCDDYGNELPEETVLVKMTKTQYDTMCVGNPMFKKLDVYGGQWDKKEK